jgi:hypothetical protein
METAFTLAPLIAPALFAVREELEMPLDAAEYLRQSDKIMEGLKGAVGTSMQRVDDVLAGGGGEANDKAEAAGAS